VEIFDVREGVREFLGVDESLSMRLYLSWGCFRPSESGWDEGARWHRCDLVGGPSDAKAYADLPATAKGLFRARPPEQWLTCAQGPTALGAKRVHCGDKHDSRAATTIKLGEPKVPYPEDRVAEVQSRDHCSDSVGAWTNYPIGFEFGYTWVHEAEWQAGNRLAICRARTDR